MGGDGNKPIGETLYADKVSALYRRERTGQGGMVGASLLAGGLGASALSVQAKLWGRVLPPRQRRHKVTNACVNTYRCRDGRWFSMMILNEDRQLSGLLEALGCAELASDPRFATPQGRRSNAPELVAIFDRKFAERDFAEWRGGAARGGITFQVGGAPADNLPDPHGPAGGAAVPGAGRPGVRAGH